MRGRWEYRDAGILDRTHLRFFTRSSMSGLFSATGREVVQEAPINISRATGKWRLVALLPGSVEFMAEQYVLVARRAP